MSHMTILILRTILMYVVIFVTMRIMGKREIGKLSIFDLVISIMIAEIAVLFLKISKADLGGTCSYRRFGCHSGRTCLYRLKIEIYGYLLTESRACWCPGQTPSQRDGKASL